MKEKEISYQVNNKGLLATAKQLQDFETQYMSIMKELLEKKVQISGDYGEARGKILKAKLRIRVK